MIMMIFMIQTFIISLIFWGYPATALAVFSSTRAEGSVELVDKQQKELNHQHDDRHRLTESTLSLSSVSPSPASSSDNSNLISYNSECFSSYVPPSSGLSAWINQKSACTGSKETYSNVTTNTTMGICSGIVSEVYIPPIYNSSIYGLLISSNLPSYTIQRLIEEELRALLDKVPAWVSQRCHFSLRRYLCSSQFLLPEVQSLSSFLSSSGVSWSSLSSSSWGSSYNLSSSQETTLLNMLLYAPSYPHKDDVCARYQSDCSDFLATYSSLAESLGLQPLCDSTEKVIYTNTSCSAGGASSSTAAVQQQANELVVNLYPSSRQAVLTLNWLPNSLGKVLEVSTSPNNLSRATAWDVLGFNTQCPHGFVVPDDPSHPLVSWEVGTGCAEACRVPMWTDAEHLIFDQAGRFGVSLSFPMVLIVTLFWSSNKARRSEYYLLTIFMSIATLFAISLLPMATQRADDRLCYDNATPRSQLDDGPTSVCVYQAVGFMYFSLAGSFAWLLQSFHLYTKIVLERKAQPRRRQRIIMVSQMIFIFIVPLAPVLTLWENKGFGFTGTITWCYLTNAVSVSVSLWTAYLPGILTIVVGAFFTVCSVMKITFVFFSNQMQAAQQMRITPGSLPPVSAPAGGGGGGRSLNILALHHINQLPEDEQRSRSSAAFVGLFNETAGADRRMAAKSRGPFLSGGANLSSIATAGVAVRTNNAAAADFRSADAVRGGISISNAVGAGGPSRLMPRISENEGSIVSGGMMDLFQEMKAMSPTARLSKPPPLEGIEKSSAIVEHGGGVFSHPLAIIPPTGTATANDQHAHLHDYPSSPILAPPGGVVDEQPEEDPRKTMLQPRGQDGSISQASSFFSTTAPPMISSVLATSIDDESKFRMDSRMTLSLVVDHIGASNVNLEVSGRRLSPVVEPAVGEEESQQSGHGDHKSQDTTRLGGETTQKEDHVRTSIPAIPENEEQEQGQDRAAAATDHHEVFNAGINHLIGFDEVVDGGETAAFGFRAGAGGDAGGHSSAHTALALGHHGSTGGLQSHFQLHQGGGGDAVMMAATHLLEPPIPDYQGRGGGRGGGDFQRSVVESMWFPSVMMEGQVGIEPRGSGGGGAAGAHHAAGGAAMSRSMSAFNLATGNLFMHPLIRANMSIVVFTVVHLLVWALVIIYDGLTVLFQGPINASYNEWVHCVFDNFDASHPSAWEIICGAHAEIRPSLSLAVVTILAVVLYGSLISAMHFSTIARMCVSASWSERIYQARISFIRALPAWVTTCCLKYLRIDLATANTNVTDVVIHRNAQARGRLEFLFTSHQSLPDAAARMLAPFRVTMRRR